MIFVSVSLFIVEFLSIVGAPKELLSIFEGVSLSSKGISASIFVVDTEGLLDG